MRAELLEISSGYFRVAGVLGAMTGVIQFSSVMLAASIVNSTQARLYTPIWMAVLAYSAFLTRLFSDRFTAAADRALRVFEWLDGSGNRMASREYAELRDDMPWIVRKVARHLTVQKSWFYNQDRPSAARLAANTYESAWWTNRLSADMILIELARCSALLLAALLILRAAFLPTFFTPESAVNISSAVILFLITQGPVRRILDFVKLREGSRSVLLECEAAAGNSISLSQATHLLSKYQLVRKGSPRIPTYLWAIRRKSLNRLWPSVAANLKFGDG